MCNFHQLSDFARGGSSGFLDISKRVGCGVSAVLCCWSKWSQNKENIRRSGSGRPRSTIACEDRAFRLYVLRDRFSTLRPIGNDWLAVNGQRVPMSVIYIRTRSFGQIYVYHSFDIIKLQDLSHVRRNNTGPMSGIKLSSSRYCLRAHDGHRRRDVGNVLESMLIPTLFFNKIMLEFLERAQAILLPWPSGPPDVSLIEHGVKIGNLQYTLNNLVNSNVEFRKPGMKYRSLISSMPSRVAECITNRGGTTHY
ncbi:hypothetical protein BDFB_006559 [Asbolus verrucosus]|uniref:Uncharacterized protein n=1 Tax=Asbolus verrucosus TaxID=1661398 RepID=A0A482VRJ2_ASBVE|nr:hypothetical protein BDFB_006559 [Asbolus verrucosus]